MKITIAVVLAATLWLAAPALAQEPPIGGEKFDLEAAMKEVMRLLEESEALLAKSLKDGDTDEAAKKAKEVREAIDKLLKKSKKNGEEAVSQMTEILENAPQCRGQSGQEQQEPDPEKQKKDKESEQQVNERDPKNSAQGDPKDSQDSKDKPKGTKKPLEAEKDPEAAPDPERDWMALLPEKMRQAVKNGEWDKVPPKWRKLIEEYTKKMADVESGSR